MANELVNGWDAAVLLASEVTFGTTPDPATSQSFEFIDIDTGPAELGEVRGKKDRGAGRGMQSAFVEGRVKPIPWSIDASVKSRATNATVPQEAVLYKAAGLTEAVGGSSVTYTVVGAPDVYGASVYRVIGKSPYIYEAEQLRGGVVKTLRFSGGDTEIMVRASGEAIGKYFLGYAPSITLADGSGTSLTPADAEEAYRLGEGWYQCQSEVLKVTANPFTGSALTIARAQLSTTGAAHSAQVLRPYIPTLTYAGSPISEGGTVTTTIGGVAYRTTKWSIDLTTGIDLMPGQSGSRYVLGPKVIRYDATVNVTLALTREQVGMFGKVRSRATQSISIVQSTGTAGGIFTAALPYTEMNPFKTPTPTNDITFVDVSFRCRDNSGNDMFTLTLT